MGAQPTEPRVHQTYAWSKLRKTLLAQHKANDTPCLRCGRPIDWQASGNTPYGPTLDHITALAEGGEPYAPDNLAPAHRRCNLRHGSNLGHLKRWGSPSKREMNPTGKGNGEADSFRAVSLTPMPAISRHTPKVTGSNAPLPADAFDVPWISPLLDRMPASAGLPLAMTAPHPRAVGSYGAEAVDWVRREMGVDLRWFQQLSMVRQLEHDSDGALVWRSVVESTPRRVGKSVRLRCLCCWRVAHADLLGEPQTVVFTGKDLPICKEIHRSSWAWAKARGWTVRRGMGIEEVESPDGSRWLVRSQGGVYGYPAGLGACDESWAVPASVIAEGLQPALMDRRSPQLLLTSTAHTKATALMVRRITDGLDTLDGSGSSLLMLWAAPDDADPADHAAWRAASPYWDDSRELLVADAWAQVLSGQESPDPLEPDPVAGFRAQYLNQWPSLASVSVQPWGARLAGLLPPQSEPEWSGPVVLAVESDPGGGSWGVAASDGEHVQVVSLPRRSDAVAWLRSRFPVASELCCHDSVARQFTQDFASEITVQPVPVVSARAATAVFKDAVASGGLSWSGVLAEQLRGAAVAGGSGLEYIDGVRSSGSVAALKAGVWAYWRASTSPIEAPEIW